MELLADCHTGKLNVKFIGENACKAGSSVLKEKNDSVVVQQGDLIELLANKYIYKVEFEPVAQAFVEETTNSEEMVGKQTTLNSFLTKRKSCDDPSTSDSFLKKQKIEDSWLEVDGGKLIVFTSSDVQHKSKVYKTNHQPCYGIIMGY